MKKLIVLGFISGLLTLPHAVTGQDCYALESKHCSNYATPEAGTCTGDCDPIIVPGTPPTIGWECPQDTEEAYPADPWVKQKKKIYNPEYGLDSWEDIDDKACIIFQYCLCKPPAGPGNHVCEPCECDHEDHLISQTQPTGDICQGE